MKQIVFIIQIIAFTSLLSHGQEKSHEKFDSVFIYSDMPSPSKLRMIENCNYAKIIAEQDIQKQEIKILIIGGIAPVIYSSDSFFENKYHVSYYDFVYLPPNEDCVFKYNVEIFKYLNSTFGKRWKKEIRKNAYGLKQLKRKRKFH